MTKDIVYHKLSCLMPVGASRCLWSVICITLLTVLPHCTDSRMIREISSTQPGSQGFFDDHTLYLRIDAQPDPHITGQMERRTSARKQAVLSAQHRAIQYLIGYNVEGAHGAFNMKYISQCIMSRFNETVKKGEVIKEKYGHNDMCEIIYVVRSPKLKQAVSRCVTDDE